MNRAPLQRNKSRFQKASIYALALLSIVIVVFAEHVLGTQPNLQASILLFDVVIVVCAWFGGLLPAIMAITLVLGYVLLFGAAPTVPQTALFLLESGGLSALLLLYRRNLRQLHIREYYQSIAVSFSQFALTGASLEVIIEQALELIRQHLDVPLAAVYELLPGLKQARMRAGVGWQDSVAGSSYLHLDTNVYVRQVLQRKTPLAAGPEAALGTGDAATMLQAHHVQGALSMAITSPEDQFGIIAAYTTRPRSFTPDDILFMQLIANVVASSLARLRSEQALREREHQYRWLLEATEYYADRTARLQTVTAALSESRTVAEVAVVVMTQVIAVLEASAGAMLLLQDGVHFQLTHSYQVPESFLHTWQQSTVFNNTLLGQAATEQRPIIVALDPAEQTDDQQFQLVVVLPLMLNGRITGSIPLLFQVARVLDAEDISFAMAIANQCAQALDRARLFEMERQISRRAQQVRDRLKILSDASDALAATLDPAAAMQQLAHITVPATADLCAIYILDNERPQLAGLAHAMLLPEYLVEYAELRQSDPQFTTYIANVIKSQFDRERLLTYDDLLADLARVPSVDWPAVLAPFRIKQVVGVPMVARQRTFGIMIYVLAHGERAFTADDIALIKEIGRRAAIALDNARHYRDTQEAVLMRDQFLMVAAHELKTPMTSLVGYAEYLQRRFGADATLPERDVRAVNVLMEQANRLNRLIATLFDLSQIEQGVLPMQRSVIDVASLLERLVQTMEPFTEQHPIRIGTTSTLPLIYGDPLRLEQVFYNLLQNAIKYSPDGGDILVTIGADASAVEVRITDHGLGIPAHAVAQLFRRFYRASNIDPRRISGMGLGLFVVREIVRLHGGEVSVHSQEQQGSTFTVRLPHVASEQGAQGQSDKEQV